MMIKILAGLFGVALMLVGAAWAGLQVKAEPFPIYSQRGKSLGSVPIPDDLPEPVQRYARMIFGDRIPVVESGVVIGRAKATFNGLTLPIRFKFYYDARGDYYHYMQATLFGRPVLTVDERFLDGHSILDIPGQWVENDPHTDHAANQGFWAEVFVWAPSIFFTDARIEWETIDDNTVRAIIPGADAEEAFLIRFDPATGLLTELSTQRYQGETRIPWTNSTVAWREFNGVQIPALAETQWRDDAPWAKWAVEQVVWNVDVSGRMRQFGGKYQD